MTLSEFEDPDRKILYCIPGIGEKVAKKSFDELMVVFNCCMSDVCFDSGTNDEVDSSSTMGWLANNSQ